MDAIGLRGKDRAPIVRPKAQHYRQKEVGLVPSPTSGERARIEGFQKTIFGLQEQIRTLRNSLGVLLKQKQALVLEVGRLKQLTLSQKDELEGRERHYQGLVEDIAKIAGICFSASYMTPLGSPWIKPRLHPDLLVYPWRRAWGEAYDPSVRCPIETGLEEIMPWMKPGPNPLITLVPIGYGEGMIKVLLLRQGDNVRFIDLGDPKNVWGNYCSRILLETGDIQLQSVTIFQHKDTNPEESIVDSSSNTNSAWFQQSEIKAFPCDDVITHAYVQGLQSQSNLEWVLLNTELEDALPLHQKGLVFKTILGFGISRYPREVVSRGEAP